MTGPVPRARIDLESGERGEVELRAVGVHAVELLVQRLRSAGTTGSRRSAATVDHRLCQQGQDPAVKARPHHRCRCTYHGDPAHVDIAQAPRHPGER